MSTPEKPRPTLDETLHRIDTVLAEPSSETAKTVDHPETPSSGRCSKTGLDWAPDGTKTVIHCKFPADPITGQCRFHSDLLLARGVRPRPEPRWPLVAAALAEFAETAPPVERPGWLARALHRIFA